jgi:hypothetical protein
MINPITPITRPARFTEEEAARWRRGECGYQTAYGLPGSEYCERRGDPLNDFGYCAEHDREVREEERDRRAAGL